jgi:uncharacterized repeat protein (TIGR03803 family)
MKGIPAVTLLGAIFISMALFPVDSSAQAKETVLHSFTYESDGGFPYAGLSFDANGNLYGVTYFAGDPDEGICCGVVFQLASDGAEGWNFNVIHTFTGSDFDGEAPSGSVVFDAAGNMYGTTQIGGAGFCGVVYELKPMPDGRWEEKILHHFNNYRNGVINDGCMPSSYLVFDKQGNIYGTTQRTGASDCATNAGCGTVFELSPQANGTWSETQIHRFPNTGTTDGIGPYGGLVFDIAGNLWGTTQAGGTTGQGTVFELTPAEDGKWKERVAFNFTGDDTGWFPVAGLTPDSAGNLYGTTFYGGRGGVGVVFGLTPHANGQVSETLVHQFATCTQTACPDGLLPYGGLVADSVGNLYGTAELGGAAGTFCNQNPEVQEGCGIVYKLSPNAHGSWSYSIVYRFPGAGNGAYLTDDHLAVDSNGNIFGTTLVGGDPGNQLCPVVVPGLDACGVVFEITP